MKKKDIIMIVFLTFILLCNIYIIGFMRNTEHQKLMKEKDTHIKPREYQDVMNFLDELLVIDDSRVITPIPLFSKIDEIDMKWLSLIIINKRIKDYGFDGTGVECPKGMVSLDELNSELNSFIGVNNMSFELNNEDIYVFKFNNKCVDLKVYSDINKYSSIGHQVSYVKNIKKENKNTYIINYITNKDNEALGIEDNLELQVSDRYCRALINKKIDSNIRCNGIYLINATTGEKKKYLGNYSILYAMLEESIPSYFNEYNYVEENLPLFKELEIKIQYGPNYATFIIIYVKEKKNE